MANCITVSASAANIEPISTYTSTEYIFVTDGIATRINDSDYPLTVQHDDSADNGTTVKMDMTVQDYGTYSDYNITLDNLDSLQTSDDKIAVAEYVLKNVFMYNEEQIDFLTEKQKCDMAFAPKLNLQIVNYITDDDGSEHSYSDQQLAAHPRPLETDSKPYGNIRCILTVAAYASSKSGNATLSVSVDGTLTGLGYSQLASICAQNVACVANSSQMSGYYHQGATLTKRTFKYTESSTNNFDAIANAAGGTGIAYKCNIPNSTVNTPATNAYVVTSVRFNNSSVASGGTFNVYGNFATIKVALSDISVSFPWGISSSLGVSATKHTTTVSQKFT